MSFRNDFRLRPKRRDELDFALRMYGENEEPQIQIENMWEVYSPSTGMALPEPKPDFSEFSRGDRMYPSMMKPDIKVRWEQKNNEWEVEKERHAWRKRLAHIRFMRENTDLPLAQSLAGTDYGKALLEEFSSKQPQQPQSGTGEDLHDEFERDGVNFDPEAPIRVTPFVVPGMEESFSVLAIARDDDGRIVEKLCSLEPKDHHVHYDYDAGGRLCAVWKDERLIEEYKYGKQGERYFAATPQTGQCRFTYGPGLRLERAGEVKYSYDGEGRLVMKQDGLDVTTYEYHHSGQLQQVNLPDGRRVSYVIDPHGRRMAKSVNGKVAETYSWHDFTTLAVVAFEDGSRMEFAYDEEGDPVVMRYKDELYFFASDQAGTIYMVANKEGHEVRRIIRDSFGNLIVDTNESMSIPVGFAGGLYDRDTGLVHFGHREYDPSCGRFITPDPIGIEGGDVDVYGYCHDDPVNFVDRVGLAKRGIDYWIESGRNLYYDQAKDKSQSRTMEYRKGRDDSKSQTMEGKPEHPDLSWEEQMEAYGGHVEEQNGDGEDSSDDEKGSAESAEGSDDSGSSEGKGSGESSDSGEAGGSSSSQSPLTKPADRNASGGNSSAGSESKSRERKGTEGQSGDLAQRFGKDAPDTVPKAEPSGANSSKPSNPSDISKPVQPQHPGKKDGSKNERGTFGKIADGLKGSAKKISKGMDGLGEKSAEGTKKAVTKGGKAFKDGLKAAGKASKEVAEQYKNNKAFRNAFNTAIAAGMAPKAAAAYAAGGGAAMANAYRTLMQRGAAKASTYPLAERVIKEGYDFATAHDPTSIPNYTIGGAAGSLWSSKNQIKSNAKDIYNGAKDYLRK